MSNGLTTQDVSKPLFAKGNDVPFYYNWFAGDTNELRRGGTAPTTEGTRSKTKKYQTIENIYGEEPTQNYFDAWRETGTGAGIGSGTGPVRPASRGIGHRQTAEVGESKAVRNQISQISKIYVGGAAKPIEKSARPRQSRADSRDSIQSSQSDLKNHKPTLSAVSKDNYTGPLYEKSNNYMSSNQAGNSFHIPKENPSVFQQKECFPPFAKSTRPMTGHGRRQETLNLEKSSLNPPGSSLNTQERSYNYERAQKVNDDPWDLDFFNSTSDVFGQRSEADYPTKELLDNDDSRRDVSEIKLSEPKFTDLKSKRLEPLNRPITEQRTVINAPTNNISYSNVPSSIQNFGDDIQNSNKNSLVFENVFGREVPDFDFDLGENLTGTQQSKDKVISSSNTATGLDVEEPKSHRTQTAMERLIFGGKSASKEKVVFTKKFAKAKQILDSKLVPKKYAEDELNQSGHQTLTTHDAEKGKGSENYLFAGDGSSIQQKSFKKEEEEEPALPVSEQNLALISEINSQRPICRKKAQALNLGDEFDPIDGKMGSSFSSYPSRGQGFNSNRPPSRHRTPSKALGLDLPQGETDSFPVKNMYSDNERPKEREKETNSSISHAREKNKPKEIVNDLDRYDCDHVINLSDFLDSEDDNDFRAFQHNGMPHGGYFENEEEQDSIGGHARNSSQPNIMDRPVTQNMSIRNSSIDNGKPSTAVEKKALMNFQKYPMQISTTPGYLNKAKLNAVNRLDLDNLLDKKKKEPVNSFDFVDISYENINPDRDQSDFQYKKRTQPLSSKSGQNRNKMNFMLKNEGPILKDNFFSKNSNPYTHSYRDDRSNIIITHNKSTVVKNEDNAPLPFETSLGKDFVSLFAK